MFENKRNGETNNKIIPSVKCGIYCVALRPNELDCRVCEKNMLVAHHISRLAVSDPPGVAASSLVRAEFCVAVFFFRFRKIADVN